MDQYEIIELNADGTGYAKFFFADGSSCGQQLHGMPIDDKAALEDALTDLMAETKARLAAQVKTIHPEVTALIGQRKDPPTRTK